MQSWKHSSFLISVSISILSKCSYWNLHTFLNFAFLLALGMCVGEKNKEMIIFLTLS